MAILSALSVSHFINSVGAKAGFAAIIGLALVVLLFFAQMRETARLREDAEDAAAQVAQLEQRLATLARGVAASSQTQGGPAQSAPAQAAVAPRPASAAAAAPPPSRAVPAVAQAPVAPAGLGAPALASATRMIPTFDDGRLSARRSAAPAPVSSAATDGGDRAPGSRAAAAVMDPPGPPPATAAGGAPPAAAAGAAGPATGGNGSDQGGRSPAPVGAPGRATRPVTGSRPTAPRNGGRPAAASDRRDYRSSGSGRGRNLLVAAIALVVVAAVVVVLLLLTSSGSGGSTAQTGSSPNANSASTKHRTRHRAATIKPASVSVTVLNGTATAGLAGDVTRKLQADGYKLGTPATATDQTHTTTVVGYLPGHRAAALIVAKSLGLGADAVAAADQSSQAVACPSGTTCTAQVIVTVGANLASYASSSSSATTAPAAGATTTG